MPSQLEYLTIGAFSENQIEYIIENFSKTSCRKIAGHLNSKSRSRNLKILPSRVFSIAKLTKISIERRIQKLIENGEIDKATEISNKVELLLPKKKVG